LIFPRQVVRIPSGLYRVWTVEELGEIENPYYQIRLVRYVYLTNVNQSISPYRAKIGDFFLGFELVVPSYSWLNANGNYILYFGEEFVNHDFVRTYLLGEIEVTGDLLIHIGWQGFTTENWFFIDESYWEYVPWLAGSLEERHIVEPLGFFSIYNSMVLYSVLIEKLGLTWECFFEKFSANIMIEETIVNDFSEIAHILILGENPNEYIRLQQKNWMTIPPVKFYNVRLTLQLIRFEIGQGGFIRAASVVSAR